MMTGLDSLSPLFIKALEAPEVRQSDARCIFFGTGLVTPKAMSQGLPFDFLALVAAAEGLRRQTGERTRILHYIPDQTALQNAFVTAQDVDILSGRIADSVRKIVRYFGIEDHYAVLRGCAIDGHPERNKLLAVTAAYAAQADIPREAKGYVTEQLADMAFFRRHYGGAVKLSWTMARNAAGLGKGFDESFFDGHYRYCFPDDGDRISFAYLQPGRRLNPKANRACPYTDVAGEPRLSLRSGFNLAALSEQSGIDRNSATYRDAVAYWDTIAGALAALFPVPAQADRQATAEARIDALHGKVVAAMTGPVMT